MATAATTAGSGTPTAKRTEPGGDGPQTLDMHVTVQSRNVVCTPKPVHVFLNRVA